MRKLAILGTLIGLLTMLAACDYTAENVVVKNNDTGLAEAVEAVEERAEGDTEEGDTEEDVAADPGQAATAGETAPSTENRAVAANNGVLNAPPQPMRASDVQDYQVENTANDSLGELDDMVINLANGQIVLATLEFGGLLDIGEKAFPIPLSVLRYQEETREALTNTRALAETEIKENPNTAGAQEALESDAPGSDVVVDSQLVILPIVMEAALILNVPDEVLADAPGYNEDLPDVTSPLAIAEIEAFYRDLGENIIGHALRTVELDAIENRAITLSDLRGSSVYSPAGEALGEIDKVMVDLRAGQVVYLVLSFGGFLDIGDSEYAVPFEAFEVVPADAELDAGVPRLVLDVSETQLSAAPTLDDVDIDAIGWDLGMRDFWLDLIDQ